MFIQTETFSFNVLYEGNPNAPLVILSHALMANLHLWDSTVLALHVAGYSTIRYDHVGHGSTSRPTENQIGKLHFDDFCLDIERIISAVAPERTPFAIIGCSMGGVLAIRYAMLHPGRVKKVVSCGAPGINSLEESKPKWAERIDLFTREGVAPLAELTVERWIPGPFPEGVRDEALKQTLECTLEGYRACADAIVNYKYRDELGKLQTEDVMILVGEKDSAIGPKELSVELASEIRGGRFMELKDCGHVPPLHRRKEFEKVIVDFFGS
ncbi:uncharacterized protein N0V89_004148 [Didymosphaeria variabile]|uniref:AB hydrolase-1 domain-containing protein n=1 Tax=Didymosphaeria variabile TaxID=1932322 RepID=A0A9W8XRX5_9PLEO|nr:uncharacterized protein N0V89_004148 [Didymosphaeria variabile]KAJ4356120.1 hypothetical protein N0V89_004148 [Didymosphaeria variabile]